MDITRYDVVVEKIEKDGMLETVASYMSPKEGGEFIRYSDHMEIMEAIGAGGVSGRITSKTLNQHRAEFQDWYTTLRKLPKDADLTQYDECFYLWKAWKAALGVKE